MSTAMGKNALEVLSEADPVLCQKLIQAIRSFPHKDGHAVGVGLDAVQARSQATPLSTADVLKHPTSRRAVEWTTSDLNSCVARSFEKSNQHPGKAAERFITDLLPELSLPEPWVSFRSSKGKLFFLNPVSRDTTWHHPLEFTLREIAAFCKSLIQMDEPWRGEMLSSHMDTIDSDEQAELARWELSDGHWRHGATGEVTSADPRSHVAMSFQCKRIAMQKLSNPRYLWELRQIEPPPERPKRDHMTAAIQWLMNNLEDESQGSRTPLNSSRSQPAGNQVQEVEKQSEAEGLTAMSANKEQADEQLQANQGEDKEGVVDGGANFVEESECVMTFSISERCRSTEVQGNSGGTEIDEAATAGSMGSAEKPTQEPVAVPEGTTQESQNARDGSKLQVLEPDDIKSEASGEAEQVAQLLAQVMLGPQGAIASKEPGKQAVVPQLPANGASSAVQLPELLNRLAEVLPSEAKGDPAPAVPADSALGHSASAHETDKATNGPDQTAELSELLMCVAESLTKMPPGGSAATVSQTAVKGIVAALPAEGVLVGQPARDGQEVAPRAIQGSSGQEQCTAQTEEVASGRSKIESREDHLVEFIIRHLQVIDAKNTGRISADKLCIFFELLGIDVTDLSKAIAAHDRGSQVGLEDGTVDYAAFLRWLVCG